MQLFADLYDEIVAFPKPTIAACHGDVVGGGAEIAIACDMRVGGSNLRMRFPGAALGVPVGPARLVTLCGLAAAKYLLLSSRTVGADEALRLGLVNRVAPAAATEESALELAAEVAAHPPEAVARLKRMLHEWDDVEGRSAPRARARSSGSAPARACRRRGSPSVRLNTDPRATGANYARRCDRPQAAPRLPRPPRDRAAGPCSGSGRARRRDGADL